MTQQTRETPQFFLTAPTPCPYLAGLQERKVFTHLVGERASELNDVLTHGGFRRSQLIAYRPACENCRLCVSVRVMVDDFSPSVNQKRVLRRNADLFGTMRPAVPTGEQYSLFRAYIDARHADGGMADMGVLDYATMVEDSHVATSLVEYRQRAGQARKQRGTAGPLVGVCLTDRLSDGLSMVYAFYDTALVARSLGTFMILDHIAKAAALGLPYLYLGYWVEGSRKMDYKRRFRPQQHLITEGWACVDPAPT